MRVTTRRPVVRRHVGDSSGRARPDTVVVEEPLEIRVSGRPLTVTMRTPGDDFDLVLGFLLTEALVAEPENVASMRYCAGDTGEGNTYNVIDVALAAGVPAPVPNRSFIGTSSCGVCGKASLEVVRERSRYRVADDPLRVPPELVVTFPDALRERQRIFDRTGGLHAAGLFTATGELLCVREDVGRHNAVDKVLGWAAREHRLPLRETVLQVSGRVSFELVQKAVMCGVPFLSAVSAPSSLAVDLATEEGMTLAAFVRDTTMNLYARADRVG